MTKEEDPAELASDLFHKKWGDFSIGGGKKTYQRFISVGLIISAVFLERAMATFNPDMTSHEVLSGS